MKIVFMGSPKIAEEALQELINQEMDIELVVTNPDKRKGRGKKMLPTEVKVLAEKNNIKVLTPNKIKGNEQFLNELKEIKPDLIVVVAYGKILPLEVLDSAKLGSINLHVSLLPKYRGATPIQHAILNGDEKTGVTIMRMNERMDEGDILSQKIFDIHIDDTSGDIFEKSSQIGKKLLAETIKNIKKHYLRYMKKNEDNNNDDDEQKQDDLFNKEKFYKNISKKQEGEAIYAPMLDKSLRDVDWSLSSFEIHNRVRALNPFMGVNHKIQDVNVKLWNTKLLDKDEIEKIENEILNKRKEYKGYKEHKEENTEKEIQPGDVKIKGKRMFLKTGDGFLEILNLQPESKRKIDAMQFIAGYVK